MHDHGDLRRTEEDAALAGWAEAAPRAGLRGPAFRAELSILGLVLAVVATGAVAGRTPPPFDLPAVDAAASLDRVSVVASRTVEGARRTSVFRENSALTGSVAPQMPVCSGPRAEEERPA